MPRIGLDPSNKSHSIFDTDRFTLKGGEKARILVLDEEFEVEFIHQYWDTDDENRGNYICQGDYKTVMENGSDPRCKFCQAADKGSPIKKAKRKFATLVVVYRTNSKGVVLTPVAVDVQPWVFGEDKFGDLISKKEQWTDLKQHDIFVECLVENFQRFRLDVLPDAVWLSNKETQALVAASWKEAKGMYAKDLRALLGRDVSDPERLADIINSASGGAPVPDYASAGTIDAMFSDTAVSAPQNVDVDFGALLNETPAASKDAVSLEPSTVPEEDSISAASMDFDDLLNS